MIPCYRCKARVCRPPKGETDKTYKFKLSCTTCTNLWLNRVKVRRDKTKDSEIVGFGKHDKLKFRQLLDKHPWYANWIRINEVNRNPDLLLYLSMIREEWKPDSHTIQEADSVPLTTNTLQDSQSMN